MERQCGECGTSGMVQFEGAVERVEHRGFFETVEGLAG